MEEPTTIRADEAWSQQQVAEYLGVPVRRVRALVGAAGFPTPRVLGPRTLSWSAQAIRAWLDKGDPPPPRPSASGPVSRV